MAPVAAVSRPPGRPKLRSKADARLGLPALYTARSLDRCTRQLGHWNPFASSAAVSPEHKLDDPVTDDAKVRNVGLRVEPQPERNPNLDIATMGDDNAPPVVALAIRSVAVSSECCQFSGSLHQRSKGRGFDPLPDAFGEPGWFKHAAAHSTGSDKGVFEFGKVSTECDARAVQERRVHGWSKRRKQLSHALARGLWRWKDGFHARKRMKRCGPGGGRNSGSDKSSDRAPYGVHASDPSTAPTSKAGPFKWSDFPVTPTDSSGELFNCAGGGSGLMAEMNALGKDWTACGCSRSGDDTSGRRTDCDQCWLGSENPKAESGYGSEPGYRGDEELEFGDIDEEQDEEETEPQHLRIWTQVMARSSHAVGQPQLENHDMLEVNGQATFTQTSLQSAP